MRQKAQQPFHFDPESIAVKTRLSNQGSNQTKKKAQKMRDYGPLKRTFPDKLCFVLLALFPCFWTSDPLRKRQQTFVRRSSEKYEKAVDIMELLKQKIMLQQLLKLTLGEKERH